MQRLLYHAPQPDCRQSLLSQAAKTKQACRQAGLFLFELAVYGR